MRPYETLVLLDPRREDAELEESINRFMSVVTERGGEITATEKWGRRRLSYEINDVHEGYYVLFHYRLESSKRKEVEEALPFLEGFMRAKTVRPGPRRRKGN